MSDKLEKLLERISDATKRASESGDDRDNLVVAGELLLNEVRAKYPTIAEQEKILTKWTNMTTSAVNNFSDYKECFWEASYFFQLIIENYSVKTVLPTVKACVAVFNTEHSSDKLVIEWATAATKRCAQWIRVESAEDLSKPDLLKVIQSANAVLHKVVEAGEEFEQVVKSDTDLKDALAELNLLIEQMSAGGSVFTAANSATLAALKKEVVQIEAMVSDSAEGVIIALEQSVDLEHPSGGPLFEAYNAMCEEQASDLELQVRAAQGPLAKLAVQALFTQNEGKQGKRKLFLEALVFCKLLLQPWDDADAAHMEAKVQIATALKELDIVTALLGQFKFWAVEWNFMFGDCGYPALLSFLELARYFPTILHDDLLPNADAVAFIRHSAAQHRGNSNRINFSIRRECGGNAAMCLEALMDGLPEPAPLVEDTLFKVGGYGYGRFGGVGLEPAPAAAGSDAQSFLS